MRSKDEKARILIADDEFPIRDIISLGLTEEGYKCTVASDGSSVLRTLDGCEFNLALLDINMPGKIRYRSLKIQGTNSEDS